MTRLLPLLAWVVWWLAALWAPELLAAETLGQDMAWRELAPGLEFTHLDASGFTTSGNPLVAVLRVDPRRFRLRVLFDPALPGGRTAEGWRQVSGAQVVFNAGLYTPQHRYLGLLVQDGRQMERMLGHLDGLLVAEPSVPDLAPARVLDLRYTAFDPRTSPYRQAAQSHMLLDRYNQIRVRQSDKLANRTVVANDRQGRLVVMVTEGPHRLYDLAEFLTTQGQLGLLEVMAMDGGQESQLEIHLDDFQYSQYGSPATGGDLPLPWPAVTLPAAWGVFPR